MAKFIAIGGEPATGKSTLVRGILRELGEKNKLVQTYLHGVAVTVVGNFIIMGTYAEGEAYGGTDRFALSIQPKAVEFASKIPDNKVVLFEGDRLFNEKFLNELLLQGHQLVTFILECDEKEKKRRHQLRGDHQDETWLKGRITKIATIKKHNQFLGNRYNLRSLDNSGEKQAESNLFTILLSMF